MKYNDINIDKANKWKRLGILVSIGLPIISIALITTQPNFWLQLEAVSSRAFSKLEEPYRYPFDQSLAGNRTLIAPLQQEIAFYQERIRQYPDRALEQAALASTYLRMARLTGEGSWYLLADQTARQSLALLPIDNSEALAVLARVAEANHDFNKALQLAAQIPNPKEALPMQVTANLAMGRLEQANQAAEQLVDLTLSMHAFTLQALVKTAQGNDQEALQNFRYALEVEEAGELSHSARTRTLLGRFYYERGDLQRAKDFYQEALRIAPNDASALLNLAQLELRQGHYRAAERYYHRVAQQQASPTVFDPLILRGQAQIKAAQGDRTGAETLWAEAETQLRQSVGSLSLGHRRDLARLLLERGHSQDIAEAVSLMAAEVQLRRDADTLGTYAWALTEAKRWQEAQSIIQTALDSGVRSAKLWHQAATIAQATGNQAEANTYFQKVRAIDPNFNEKARRAIHLGVGLGS
ncbi:MAG: tetratricopeptide repeat protein [Leptolyngbya sp. IPPAS B-1204]|nr:tetratricopeptide repeat protein [Elainella sp. C42_A2020_010]RNJ69870.1 MAG: tetratricopeptide repeat protein [Leptolyngbya sp. IPPAS B-1204]